MEAAAERAGTDDLQAENWDVHFVAPGTVGPFRVLVEARCGHEPRVVCRLTLVDEGRDDAVVAAGAATFRVGEVAKSGASTRHDSRTSGSAVKRRIMRL
jgi:hypothetical protein